MILCVSTTFPNTHDANVVDKTTCAVAVLHVCVCVCNDRRIESRWKSDFIQRFDQTLVEISNKITFPPQADPSAFIIHWIHMNFNFHIIYSCHSNNKGSWLKVVLQCYHRYHGSPLRAHWHAANGKTSLSDCNKAANIC